MLELIQIDLIKQSIESHRKDVEEVLLYTKNLEVQSKRDAKQAIDVIAKSRTLKDKLESKKKEITKDARDYITKINNISKEFLEPLLLVEDIILQKIDHWKIQNETQLQELQQMQEMGMDCDTFSIFEDTSHVRSDNATASERISHTIELEDKKLVPLEYLMVDEEKVNLAIKNGIAKIPGLKIEKQIKTVIRRK